MSKDDNLPRCCLIIPHSIRSSAKIEMSVRQGAKSAGYDLTSARMNFTVSNVIPDSLFSLVKEADGIIIEFSERDPIVFYAFGMARALGKPILPIVNLAININSLPSEVLSYQILPYAEHEKGLMRLSMDIKSFLKVGNFHQESLQGSSPLFIDWDSINDRDTENLCRELLVQMGFRRLDWGKNSENIDLIAELPKKDPDGFEYKELWMISVGLRSPVELLIDRMAHDPEFFMHRMLRFSSSRVEGSMFRDYVSTTFLFIVLRRGGHIKELEKLQERIEKTRFPKGYYRVNLRLRIWDQEYLTSLVHKFPSIGFKYFSSEGRIRSKTRKSYEDLYIENSDLSNRLVSTNKELEDEKNKRIRAERDSVWKDISFSAAHKLGNPIFAIETNLDPLLKRIKEQRGDEAINVVNKIRVSVEKSKVVIEEFKSLSKAQEIKPVDLILRPILDDACRLASDHGVNCSVECSPTTKVQGDAEKLAECFDELVRNAMHWISSDEKNIWIKVVDIGLEPLPEFLDTSRKYVLIHVKDNGCGIKPSEKDEIFNAFFTNRIHGTGLGLSLVRRIIEGHGGGIVEVGVYNKGADFKIFLPCGIVDSTQLKKIKSKKACQK